MHYIRFLKTPKCNAEHGSLELTALITIASDLGESFFPDDVLLRAEVVCGTEVCASKQLSWNGSMRSLKVQVKIPQKPRSAVVLKLAALEINDFVRSQDDIIMLPIVLGAWSCPVDPRGKLDTEKFIQRKFTFAKGEELCIWEETGESLARHLWPGGVTLMTCIDRSRGASSSLPSLDVIFRRSKDRSLRAIELGAGCGLVGLAMAKLHSHVDVLLTDLIEAEEITNRNIASAIVPKTSSASFEVLDWTQPLPPSTCGRPIDLILIADCTYNAAFIPSLVGTLVALMKTSPEALVVVATKTRHSSEAVFFELMTDARFVIVEQTHALAPTRYPIEEPEDAERIDVYCFKYSLADKTKRAHSTSSDAKEFETRSKRNLSRND